MGIRAQKSPPIQWIVFAFLLLCIPVAIFMFQNQTIGDLRSKASGHPGVPWDFRGGKIGPCERLTCASDEKKVSIKMSRRCSGSSGQNSADCDPSDVSGIRYCQCQPINSPTPKPTRTPTPTWYP